MINYKYYYGILRHAHEEKYGFFGKKRTLEDAVFSHRLSYLNVISLSTKKVRIVIG